MLAVQPSAASRTVRTATSPRPGESWGAATTSATAPFCPKLSDDAVPSLPGRNTRQIDVCRQLPAGAPVPPNWNVSGWAVPTGWQRKAVNTPSR